MTQAANGAFANAIANRRLSDNPNSPWFAGLFMFMGNWGGKDQFKHTLTREYLV